jgi:hypothetical protein
MERCGPLRGNPFRDVAEAFKLRCAGDMPLSSGAKDMRSVVRFAPAIFDDFLT